MRRILATFVINEIIETNHLRATVGTITVASVVSELPVKYKWLREEAEAKLKRSYSGYNHYSVGNLISVSDITDLVDFSEEG